MENELILRYAAIDALLKQPNTPTPSVIRRVLRQVHTVDAVEVGICDGCHWKTAERHQKCSCCRRNRYLKDCYERDKSNDA